MERRSALDEATVAALDTSVLINLNATQRAVKIMRALPARFVVVEAVALEMDVDVQTGRADAAQFSELKRLGCVKVVSLDARAEEHLWI